MIFPVMASLPGHFRFEERAIVSQKSVLPLKSGGQREINGGYLGYSPACYYIWLIIIHNEISSNKIVEVPLSPDKFTNQAA